MRHTYWEDRNDSKNEYNEARNADDMMIKVLNRSDLTDMQKLNYIRTVETSAKLLHLSLVNKLLKEQNGT